MQLRPRQIEFVDRCLAAVNAEGNALGVAPTGAGKTVMLSAIASKLPTPIMVLQHRDELVEQNSKTFFKMAKGIPIGVWTAGVKDFRRAGATFGMIQTVANAIEDMPKLGTLIVDEAHHITADTYLKVLASARAKNPDLKLVGVTATPGRGDKRTLRTVFNNVADVISVRELIATGHLVPPKTFVVDVGVREELKNVRKLTSDFDMDAVAEIMDKMALNEKVVEEWKRLAGDRRTAVFCANVAHARHVMEAFAAAGVRVCMVDGAMAAGDRSATLEAFDKGNFQVIVNVAVLTEGWDCQPVSCVVLLRPSSFRSTMVQMIGRGLRKLDPERYPGQEKHDCVVLDFGTSILQHGSIETENTLGSGEVVACAGCGGRIPKAVPECPLCGAAQREREQGDDNDDGQEQTPREAKERGVLRDFVLTEVDLLRQSPYRWEELWPGVVMMASAFDAWGAIVHYGGRWYAIGGAKDLEGVRLLGCETERLVALASADDFLREHGNDADARKNKRWLSQPPSDKQLQALGLSPMQAVGVTRYRACCLLTWKFAESKIKQRVQGAVNGLAQAA